MFPSSRPSSADSSSRPLSVLGYGRASAAAGGMSMAADPFQQRSWPIPDNAPQMHAPTGDLLFSGSASASSHSPSFSALEGVNPAMNLNLGSNSLPTEQAKTAPHLGGVPNFLNQPVVNFYQDPLTPQMASDISSTATPYILFDNMMRARRYPYFPQPFTLGKNISTTYISNREGSDPTSVFARSRPLVISGSQGGDISDYIKANRKDAQGNYRINREQAGHSEPQGLQTAIDKYKEETGLYGSPQQLPLLNRSRLEGRDSYIDNLYQYYRDPTPDRDILDRTGKVVDTLSERENCPGCKSFLGKALPTGSNSYYLTKREGEDPVGNIRRIIEPQWQRLNNPNFQKNRDAALQKKGHQFPSGVYKGIGVADFKP